MRNASVINPEKILRKIIFFAKGRERNLILKS